VPPLRIRPATPGDVEAVLACLRAAFEPFRAEYTAGAYLDTVLTEEAARARLGSMIVLVAEEPPGRIVGTLAGSLTSPREGHLRGMAVLPARQGQGVATALLQRVLAELASRGCRRVTLDTTRPLRRAVRFYEKNGFRRSGRTSDCFGMPLDEYVRVLE
jgi:GNAT superfamily N-acetyltransferase